MNFPIELWMAMLVFATLMKMSLIFFEVNTLSPPWATGLVLLMLFSFTGQNLIFLAAVPVFLIPPGAWSWRPVFKIRHAGSLVLALAAATGFGAWWLRAGILTFAYRVLNLAPGKLLELDYQSGTWGTLLLVGLLIPICWELVFRGFVQSAYETLTPRWSWLWTGALFGLLFVSSGFPGIAASLVLGLVLGWLVWQTGSIWPAIVAHVVHHGTGWLFAGNLQTALYATQIPLALPVGAVLGLVLVALTLKLIASRAKAEPEPAPDLDRTKVTVWFLLPLLIIPLVVSYQWPHFQAELPVLRGRRLLAQGEYNLAAEHLAKVTFAAGDQDDTELDWLALEAFYSSGRLYDAIRLIEQMKVLRTPRWMTQAQTNLVVSLAESCFEQDDMYWAARLWSMASEARFRFTVSESYEHALAHTIAATARWDVRHQVDSDSWVMAAVEKHASTNQEGILPLPAIHLQIESLYSAWIRQDSEPKDLDIDILTDYIAWLRTEGQELSPDLQKFALELATVAEAMSLGIRWQQEGLDTIKTELDSVPTQGLEWLLTTGFAKNLNQDVWKQVHRLRPELDWQQLNDYRRLNGEDKPKLPKTSGWNAELLLKIDGIGASWSADGTYLAMTSPRGGIHTHLWPVTGTDQDITTLQGRILWAPQAQTYIWEQMGPQGTRYWLVEEPGEQGRQLEPKPNNIRRWLNQDSILMSMENMFYRYFAASSELESVQYKHSLAWLSSAGMQVQRQGTGLVLLDTANNSLAQLNYPISQTFFAHDNSPQWSPSGTSFVFSYSERRMLPRRHWILSADGLRELKLPPHTHIVGWLSETQLVGYQGGEENQWLLIWDTNTGDYEYVDLEVTAPDWQLSAGPGNGLITDGTTGNVYRLLLIKD